MDKEDVDIYNGILLSHEKELNSVICNNMDDLEGNMLNEICHSEQDKHCMISLICGILKVKQINDYSKTEINSRIKKKEKKN